MDALSLEVFKARLDGTLGNLGGTLAPDHKVGGPACGRGLKLDDPWGPFQLKSFNDLGHLGWKRPLRSSLTVNIALPGLPLNQPHPTHSPGQPGMWPQRIVNF